jgi:hypothetical protein
MHFLKIRFIVSGNSPFIEITPMTDKCYIDEKTYMSSKYTWSIAMDEIEVVLTL